MTQSVNKGTNMATDPFFGLRIRRPPPHRDSQSPRSGGRIPKMFEERLKSLKTELDADPLSGVLRQNHPSEVAGHPLSGCPAPPDKMDPLQNRQERPLEGGEAIQRTDTRKPPSLELLINSPPDLIRVLNQGPATRGQK